MRIFTKLALAVAALSLMMGSACEDDSSSRKLGSMKPMGKLPNLEDVNEREPSRENYIQASIDLGCMAQTAVQQNLRYSSMTEAYRKVMEKNRFRDRNHFAKVQATMRQDQAANAIIQVGIQKCLGGSAHKDAMNKLNTDQRIKRH
ncbi:MAG: hypothetical protein JRF33_13730 [Deltaproteobacteria bacterium]|nr:hypothetical protein [Deltaproteobacteria bacterium]